MNKTRGYDSYYDQPNHQIFNDVTQNQKLKNQDKDKYQIL